MKQIKTVEEYIEREYEDGIQIHLTPDEFKLIRNAVLVAMVELEYEIETFEWMKTEKEKGELREIKRIMNEMYELPF